MLHGLLLGNLGTWYFTAAPELARSRHVVLYDLRGHGRSAPAATGYDVATQARDLAALTSDYPTMTLVGHSFGALIALRFALDHPDRVNKLALVEAPLPPSRIGELGAFLRKTPQQMVEALPDEMRAFVERGSRQAKRLLAQLVRLTLESTLVADLEAEPDIPDAELATLRRPTLLAYGTRSACAGVGERLARVMPAATLQTFDGGHYLHLDRPRELARALARFVHA
jgi:pimeloyl-ACP methyl ester carboxylesterase